VLCMRLRSNRVTTVAFISPSCAQSTHPSAVQGNGGPAMRPGSVTREMRVTETVALQIELLRLPVSGAAAGF
jgi:hypothetical protein